MKSSASKSNILLFNLEKGFELGDKLAEELNLPISPAKISHFSDGETFAKPMVSVKSKRCYVVQSTYTPVNERLMTLLIFIEALRNGGALSINVILPYFGYARQDRIINEADPITASLVARLIEAAGADRVISLDLHNNRIPEFFNHIPVDNLSPESLFVDYFKKKLVDIGSTFSDVTIVSPDHGSAKRAESFARQMPGSTVAIADKYRPQPNKAEIVAIQGEIKGKVCIIVDDMIDTAGTVCAVVERLKKEGAKAVLVGASHGIFSGLAVENLEKAGVHEIIVTDSIEPHKDGVMTVSAAPVFAQAIYDNLLF